MSSLTQEEKWGKQVYSQTWKGEYFGPRGSIAIHRKLFRSTFSAENLNPMMDLASTYYSASTHAGSRIKECPWGHLWLLRGLWCLFRALNLSTKYERWCSLENMTSAQLNVYASILLTAGFTNHAFKCLNLAREKPGLSDDTLVLLEIKFGEIHDCWGSPHLAKLNYEKADKLRPNTAPTTQVRYWRSVGSHHLQTGDKVAAKYCLGQGLNIAKEYDLTDQAIKIKGVLKKL